MKSIRAHWLEISLHLLFWALVYLAVAWLSQINYFNTEIVHGEEVYTLYVKHFNALSAFVLLFLVALFYINTYLVFRNAVLRRIYRQIIVAIILTVLFFYIIDYTVRQMLLSHFCNEHEWDHIQRNVSPMFGFITATSITLFFARHWYRNDIQRKKMEILQTKTELNFLKSQINPHFLFNTLNNLFSMAQEKQNEELANGISELSGMMRYMIYESNVETVPLEREIEYLRSFIALNKLRFTDDEIRVNFTCPENCGNWRIAPMLLIPFVENAFKYGVMIGEQSEIVIRIEVSDQGMSFFCENNDYSFIKKMDDHIRGIGLDNVRRRLELLYPDAYSLLIRNSNKKYTVELKLFKG